MSVVVGNKKQGASGVYIGRPSVLGNPYKAIPGQPGATLPAYEKWLKSEIASGNEEIIAKLKELAAMDEVTLVCYCAPKPCHGDVVKRAIEERWHDTLA